MKYFKIIGFEETLLSYLHANNNLKQKILIFFFSEIFQIENKKQKLIWYRSLINWSQSYMFLLTSQ